MVIWAIYLATQAFTSVTCVWGIIFQHVQILYAIVMLSFPCVGTQPPGSERDSHSTVQNLRQTQGPVPQEVSWVRSAVWDSCLCCVWQWVCAHVWTESSYIISFFHLSLVTVVGLCYRISTHITGHNLVQHSGVSWASERRHAEIDSLPPAHFPLTVFISVLKNSKQAVIMSHTYIVSYTYGGRLCHILTCLALSATEMCNSSVPPCQCKVLSTVVGLCPMCAWQEYIRDENA